MCDVPWCTLTRAPSAIGSSSFSATSTPVAQRERAGRDERVAAPQVVALDARQRDGDALARVRRLDRRVVDLQAAHADVAAAGLDAQLVSLGERPGPERPGRDRADAAQREDAVDEETRRPRRPLGLDRCVARARRAARRGPRRSSRSPRRPPPRARAPCASSTASSSVSASTASAFVTATTPRVDAEQPQDREVLVRLRPRALGGVDHEQEEVDARRAGDHVAHEALVPRDVDQRQPPPVRKLERRVAEVDRDAALLLLRQPVGVLAGERAHEPRLAVVDVPGGADRQRHASHARARDLVRPRRRASVRQSSSSLPSRTMPTTGGSAERSGAASSSSSAHAKLGSSASGSAPPPTRATVSSTVPPVSDASRSARARTPSSREHAQHRDPLRRVEVERERPLERRERELVRAQRALQRMAAQPLDEVGAADDDAGLRPAEQLVAGERHEIGAGREALLRRRLVRELDEDAGAEVVDERQLVPPRDLRRAARAAAAR